jgi:hypothetical protein
MEADGMLCFATALEALQKHNLVKQVNRADILANMPIRNVSYNSKEVKPGTLFVCKGLNYKKEYLQKRWITAPFVMYPKAISRFRRKLDLFW